MLLNIINFHLSLLPTTTPKNDDEGASEAAVTS